MRSPGSLRKMRSIRALSLPSCVARSPPPLSRRTSLRRSQSSSMAAVGSMEVLFCEGPAVLSNALAGLAPEDALDTSPIAAELRRALAAAAFSEDLAPQISIELDGGGRQHGGAILRRSGSFEQCARRARSGRCARYEPYRCRAASRARRRRFLGGPRSADLNRARWRRSAAWRCYFAKVRQF